MGSSDDVIGRLEELVDGLVGKGAIRSAEVERAFRRVPRHLFLPDAPLEQVYSDNAVTTKRGAEGEPLSSSTQPSIMAGMLEQLQLEAGQRVLEIGAGTGYNAALMAEIVGPEGLVVTLDVDEDIVVGAREHLETAGHSAVQVVRRDGALGYAEAGPYERIILTVGAPDIAPAWREQLTDGGRIVLPLVLRSRQRSIAFDKQDEVLTSASIRSGIVFIPLRDTPGASENVVPLDEDSSLIVEVADTGRIDAGAVLHLLGRAGASVDASLPDLVPDEFAALATWLELHDTDFCHFFERMSEGTAGRIPSLVEFDAFRTTFGLYNGEVLALLRRSLDVANELQIVQLGPDGNVAKRLAGHLTAWNGAGRPGNDRLRVRAFTVDAVLDDVDTGSSVVIRKRSSQLVCDWV